MHVPTPTLPSHLCTSARPRDVAACGSGRHAVPWVRYECAPAAPHACMRTVQVRGCGHASHLPCMQLLPC